jgi:site-specific DNA recombinase
VDDYFRDGIRALLSVGEQVDTRSAAGRMVLNMLTVIGQWEREAIGERTSDERGIPLLDRRGRA